MERIYIVIRSLGDDDFIEVYGEEERALYDFYKGYEEILNKYKSIRTINRESINYVEYGLKSRNLKEAIKLSELDEEILCYDLKVSLEDLNRDMTFDECKYIYIYSNVVINDRDSLFEIKKELVPFENYGDEKIIDGEFAYGYFKDKIKKAIRLKSMTNKEKDRFIQVIDESVDKEEFILGAFDEIEVLNNIKVRNLRIDYKYFEKDLAGLYEDLKVYGDVN